MTKRRQFLSRMMRTLTNPPICNFDIFGLINPQSIALRTVHKIKFYMWVASNSAATSRFELRGCNYSTGNTCNLVSDSNVIKILGGKTYTINTINTEEISIRNDNGVIKVALNGNVHIYFL